MVKVRCTVYNSRGEELFWEEDGDRGVAAFNASERVRAEYPLLVGVEWQFDRIYLPIMPHEPLDTLAEWDEYVLAYREGLRENA